MKPFFLFIFLLFCANLSFAQERNLKLVKAPVENPTSQKRKAVVIGMSDYGAGKSLNNTLNDANDITGVLTRLGFEVTLLKDNDLPNLEANLSNWYNTIESNDMAIFYFAGHGMEVKGQNYLIPVGAKLNSETDVRYNALNVNQVLGNMEEKRVRFKLLILDACRDNPFTRGWSRGSNEKGLAGMLAPKGTLIAFAASPGSTAQDGGTYNLRNGVFTHYLKQEILKEGATIDNILNRVANGVSNLTNDQQLPFKSGILTEDFYFIPPGNKPTPSPSPSPVPTPSPSPSPVAVDGIAINGIVWAKYNVGAKGTFVSSPQDYGNYYTFDEAQSACPAGWRVPTKSEYEILANAPHTWVTQNGKNGQVFGNGSNSIFLPATGRSSVIAITPGSFAQYWSSSVSAQRASSLFFSSDDTSVNSPSRAVSLSVRCVQE
ncbi:caspase family protein [Dysgonomonas termitidis]|uniref:Caspase family protein n=1 Tax=Dysgonomonas termitidis TaxID=1516126 RepID=A0ABV9KSJ8_9BACT